MEYAYLGSNVISFAVWFLLYWLRKDLRTMMIVMSICALPLALFDLVFVPSYWTPVTLFDIPIGIEGFLFSFSVGGVAAALYAVCANRMPRRVFAWRASLRKGIMVPAAAVTGFWAAYGLGAPNPEVAAYIAVALGLAVLLFTRRDLVRDVAWSALLFGIVYFFALKLWVVLFPGVHDWFVFEGMPYVFVWDVPGWEALFGFFFGAYWGGLYQVLFGYKLVRAKSSRRKRQ